MFELYYSIYMLFYSFCFLTFKISTSCFRQNYTTPLLLTYIVLRTLYTTNISAAKLYIGTIGPLINRYQ